MITNTWNIVAMNCKPDVNGMLDYVITYRNLLRQIAVYPNAGNLVWPVAPTEVWA